MAILWFALLALALGAAAVSGDATGFTQGALDGAKNAIQLCIGLAGVLALWMGLLRIAQEAGLTDALARRLHPVMRRLFPEIPEGHPAMASMTLNMAANMLGLGNAATPIGLRAMKELQELNPRKDTASDAMVLFLVINASSVQLIPATNIALRAAAGAEQPASIVGPTLLATLVSTVVGVAVVKLWTAARRQAPALEP